MSEESITRTTGAKPTSQIVARIPHTTDVDWGAGGGRGDSCPTHAKKQLEAIKRYKAERLWDDPAYRCGRDDN
jgi:hypothetical protein